MAASAAGGRGQALALRRGDGTVRREGLLDRLEEEPAVLGRDEGRGRPPLDRGRCLQPGLDLPDLGIGEAEPLGEAQDGRSSPRIATSRSAQTNEQTNFKS
jgi:hypothetical protein